MRGPRTDAELPRRDWLADVWIVANLEAFEHEVHSLLTDQLDTVAAARCE